MSWAPANIQDLTGPAVTPYCTDEDCHSVVQDDYKILCPPQARWAGGTDGMLSPLTPFNLVSPSSHFDTQMIAPGCMVILTDATWYPEGQYFAVGAVVSATTLTLRRPYLPAGQGLPIAPATAVSGIAFDSPTMFAYIQNAAYDINNRFGINAGTFASYGYLRYPRELRQANAYYAVALAYGSQMVGGGQGQGEGDFKSKQKFYMDLYNQTIMGVNLEWLTSPDKSSALGGRVER